MAVCLFTVKCVPERNPNKVWRLGKTDSLPAHAMVTDDNEVAYLKRGVFIILLTGLLPVFVWLYFHVFFPGMLMIDIRPKEGKPASTQVIDSSIHYQSSPKVDTVATAGQDRH